MSVIVTRAARLLVLSGFIPFAIAQAQGPDLRPAHVDSLMTRLMDSASVPGLSLALIRQNRLVYSQGYGLTKADSTQRVTSATVFDAASLSKPVFAYLVMQLVEQGVLDLDKPLYEYLPYADVADDHRYQRVTARLVLSHRSGFPNWRKNRESAELAMLFAPGERFSYSGEGFVYLQKVVEKLTGQPLSQSMTERVFRPLGMTRSSYVWQPAFDANFARPHNRAGEPSEKFRPAGANAAYSLQTTADDYARFLLAVLQPTGLKPATVSQMLSRQSRLPQRLFGEDSLSTDMFWGLGFGLEHTPAGDYFWHWGDNGNFKCYVAASAPDGNAVVYFTNSANGLSFAPELTNQLLGGTHPAPVYLRYESYKKGGMLRVRK